MRFQILATTLAALAWQADREAVFPELGLTITLPEIAGLAKVPSSIEYVKATWTGNVGASRIRIDLTVLPTEDFGFPEPGSVTSKCISVSREQNEYEVEESFLWEGEYGFAPLLSVATGDLRLEDGTVGEQYIAGGLTPQQGYALYVRCFPKPDVDTRNLLLGFLEKGVAYAGPKRDPEWSLEEIKDRWLRDVPAPLHEDFRIRPAKYACPSFGCRS